MSCICMNIYMYICVSVVHIQSFTCVLQVLEVFNDEMDKVFGFT